MFSTVTTLTCDACNKIIAQISPEDVLNLPTHFYKVRVKYPIIDEEDEYTVCKSSICLSKLLTDTILETYFPESINVVSAVISKENTII